MSFSRQFAPLTIESRKRFGRLAAYASLLICIKIRENESTFQHARRNILILQLLKDDVFEPFDCVQMVTNAVSNNK